MMNLEGAELRTDWCAIVSPRLSLGSVEECIVHRVFGGAMFGKRGEIGDATESRVRFGPRVLQPGFSSIRFG